MTRLKLKVSGRLMRKRSRRTDTRSRKVCRFTNGEVPVSAIDYKNATFLKSFLTERGKIIASRVSGNAAKYQRLLVREIKKARTMALLPYLAIERRFPSFERRPGDAPDRERSNDFRSEREPRGERSGEPRGESRGYESRSHEPRA